MLSEIGDMTDAEVQDRVLKLTATLEPLITVVMGVMILILALAIFLPIWDMYEALSKKLKGNESLQYHFDTIHKPLPLKTFSSS